MEIPTPVQEKKLEKVLGNEEGDENLEVSQPQTFTPFERLSGDYAQVAQLIKEISKTSDPDAQEIRKIQKDQDPTEPLTFIEKLADIITRFFARLQRKQI